MRVPLSFRTLSLALALGAVLIASPTPSNAQNATDVAWTTFKGDNTRSGSSPATVALPLTLEWRFSSTGPARTYSTAPLVIGAVGQQKIIFASGANIYALDLASGSQLWKSPDLSSDVVTPLTLLTTAEGDFVVGAQSRGKVFALETIKGTLKWEADAKSSITEAGPIVLNTPLGTQILTALSNGTIIAFDPTGKLISDWKVTLDKYGSSPLGNLTISPDKSRMYVQTSDQKIVCVDVPTGRQLWRANLSSRSSTAPVAGSDIVVATTMEQISAFREENGTLAWRYKLPGVVQGSPALATTPKGTTVYFGTRNGEVLALDGLTGLPRWQKKYDFTFSGSPLALKNIVLIGTSNGLLVGIDPNNGDAIWQYRMKTERTVTTRARTQRATGGEGGAPMMDGGGAAGQQEDTVRTFGISSAPAVINNRVFVLGDNAALYGFTGEQFDSDPPRVVGPTLSIPDTAKNLSSLELKETQKVIPGTGPIYFSAELDDIGTGINPSTVKIQFDDQDLDAERVDFDSQSGNLTLTLVGAAKGSLALEEGLKTIKIQAVDYAGNALDYTVSFMVDSLATPPQAPAVANPGEGGFPGGGLPGGGGGFPGGGGPGGGGGFPGGGGQFGGGGQPFGGGAPRPGAFD